MKYGKVGHISEQPSAIIGQYWVKAQNTKSISKQSVTVECFTLTLSGEFNLLTCVNHLGPFLLTVFVLELWPLIHLTDSEMIVGCIKKSKIQYVTCLP